MIGKNEQLENPDEFVFEDVKMVHWENMNPNAYWMSIQTNDGKLYHVNIHGDNLRVSLTDESL